MNVSQSQFDALSVLAEVQFIDELHAHMRARFPTRFATKDDSFGLQLARRTVELGSKYGITRRVDLRTLAECLLSLDMASSAEAVLRRSDLSGHEKVALLHDGIVFGAPVKRAIF